jgi:MFS transporter, FSR family, fosmidomycin resistance protein
VSEPALPTGDRRRESVVVGLIALAHAVSHVYMLALPPLFPVIRTELGVGFAELGLAVSVYALATGVLQTPMGFLCERVGARPVLIIGMMVNASCIFALGFIDGYWQLLTLMALSGAGSAVFHPADYQILSGTVDERRIGRAFAVHSFGGQIGFATAPLVMVGLATLVDWRFALLVIGGAGMAFVMVLAVASRTFREAGRPAGKSEQRLSFRDLLTSPATLSFFVFYGALASANLGVTHFGVAALTQFHGLDLATANFVLVSYMIAAVILVLPGGWLADSGRNKNIVVALGFGGSAIAVALVAIGGLPISLLVALLFAAGAMRGFVIASRDAIVRRSVPPASVGTVFAFVTTGVLVGHTLSPLIYGLLLDLGHGNSVFLISAIFSLGCVLTIFWHARGRPRPSQA